MTNVDQASRQDNSQPADETAANTNPTFGYGTNHSEDLITVLCWSDTHGGLVAGMVDPALFPGVYSMIAQRAVDYWKQYQRAPRDHIATLLDPELKTPGGRAEHLRRTLLNMDQVREGMNAEFVVDTANKFIRTQKLHDVVLRSAQAISNNAHVDDVEKILIEGLRTGTDNKFDPGTNLGDLDTFFELFDQHQDNEFVTGIAEIDMHHAVPARETVWVLIAVAGRGKSWGMVNLGRRALVRRKNVVHVTLELPKAQVLARYWQCICGVPQSAAYLKVERTKLVLRRENPEDDDAPRYRLVGFAPQQVEARFALRQEDARQKLRDFISYRPRMFERLQVKHYPMNTLTVAALRAYLDQLEATGFKADLLLLDHANTMRIDSDNYRLEFGRLVQDLEKLAVEKHIAVATAAQANRDAFKAKRVTIGNTGEDWSIPQTVDTVLTLTRREGLEEKHGLGVLLVEKNRLGGMQGFGVVVGQNYAHGQFALESAWLHADYETLLEAMPG